MLIEDHYKTNEEKILETVTEILHRLDRIDAKIDQLDDPWDVKNRELGILPSTMPDIITRTIIDSTNTDCKILTIDENGEPI